MIVSLRSVGPDGHPITDLAPNEGETDEMITRFCHYKRRWLLALVILFNPHWVLSVQAYYGRCIGGFCAKSTIASKHSIDRCSISIDDKMIITRDPKERVTDIDQAVRMAGKKSIIKIRREIINCCVIDRGSGWTVSRWEAVCRR